jgi:hypothetical protein
MKIIQTSVLSNGSHTRRIKENLKSRFGLTLKILSKKHELNKEIQDKEQEPDECDIDQDGEISENLVSYNYTYHETNSFKRKNSDRIKIQNSNSKIKLKSVRYADKLTKPDRLTKHNHYRAFRSLSNNGNFKLITKKKEFVEKEVQTENKMISSISNKGNSLYECSPINTRNIIYKVKSFEDQVEIDIDNEED